MDKETAELNRWHVWQAMQIGGSRSAIKPTEKDIARLEARRKLEDMQLARDLGLSMEELQ